MAKSAKPLGKSLMNLFVKMEDDPVEAKVEEKTPATAIPVSVPTMQAGKADEAISSNFVKALEKANLPGYDYFEFAKTVEALRPTLPAEQTLFQTAFASAVVMSVSKDKLLETAQHYLSVLDAKAQEFNQVVQQRTADTVTKREKDIADSDAAIKAKAEQIQKLTEEMNVLTTQKTATANEISENRMKIEQVQINFMATFDIFANKIKGDIDKIKKYIA